MVNKQNNPGVGTYYEIFVPALFALKLNNHKDVEDFSMRSNVSKEFGKFDDVVIDMLLKNGDRLCFAFQLKHKERKTKNLLPSNFEAKGDFNLEKYWKAFDSLPKATKKRYNFILFTNANFENKRKEDVNNFTMTEDDRCVGKTYFETSKNEENIYKFDVNSNSPPGYHKFLSKFTLFTCQQNFKEFETDISNVLNNENVARSYRELFRKWHQDRFTNKKIDKKTINFHLVDGFLSSSIITGYQIFSKGDHEMQLYRRAINEFDLTVIDDTKVNLCKNLTTCTDIDCISLFGQSETNLKTYKKQYKISRLKVCLLRLAQEYKIIERELNQIDNITEIKIFSYFIENLLLIDFNENSSELVYQLLQQINEDKIKFVLIGKNIELEKLKPLKIFQNLEDLNKLKNKTLYQEIIGKCTLSLQGQNPITLKQFIDCYEKMFFGTKEILQMLKKSILVGAEAFSLPVYYIPRTVSMTIFDQQTLIDLAKEKKGIIVIIFSDDLPQMQDKKQEKIRLVKVEEFIQNPAFSSKYVILITRTENYTKSQFEMLMKTTENKPLYLMKMISSNKFMLVKSTAPFPLKSGETLTVKEEDIYSSFDSPLNILIAEPGMGKSTMMKYLSNTCPYKFWTIAVVLKDHSIFFEKQHSDQELVAHFITKQTETNDILKDLISLLKERKQIIFLFDGFDEVPNSCTENVLTAIDTLSRAGFRVWLSSRPNVQEQILNKFYVFGISINEVNKVEQQKYVRDRLSEKYSDENIQRFLYQIFNSVQLVNNQQVLGIPLQLYILTQIFLDNKQNHQNITENSFILTKMYNSFFKGRFKHCVEKFHSENSSPFVYNSKSYLEQYEIPALQSLFDSEVLRDLISNDRKYETFLNNIETDKDALGIITKVKSGIATFEHHTFGEYFACAFFAKNFEIARKLKDYLFSDKYRNLMVILNIMLAEENHLHLAVIYKNLEQVENEMRSFNDSKIYDKGGRSPLHIAVGLPSHTCKPKNCHLPFANFKTLSKDDNFENNHNIIKKVLEKFYPHQRDDLFEKDSFYYAVVQKNLFAMDAILENYGMSKEGYNNLMEYNFISNQDIALCTTEWGYAQLLSVSLDKKRSKVTKIATKFQESLLHVSAASNAPNKMQILNLLIEYGLSTNTQFVYECTALRYAVINNDLNCTKMLLKKGARFNDTVLADAVREGCLKIVNFFLKTNINVKTENMLHTAASSGQVEIITYLLNLGTEINFRDEEGRTALHLAALGGHEKAFEHLLNCDADFNIVSNTGSTTLHFAASGCNINIINICLEKTQDIDSEDKFGHTPLFYAMSNDFMEFTTKLLIEKGAKVNHVSKTGKTVLHVAINSHFPDMTQFLVDKGVDVNSADYDGKTALMIACEQKYGRGIEVLIDNGAQLVCRNSSIWTCLITLSKNYQKAITKIILKKFSNTQFTDLYATPLAAVFYCNCWEIVNEFLKRDDVDLEDLLTLRTFLYNKENMQLLLQEGFKPDVLNDDQIDELIKNKMNKNMFETVKLLINNGMKINYNRLMIEIISQNQLSANEVEYCIENGADVNARDESSNTALFLLHYAILYNKIHLAELLLDRGAQINDLEALHLAVKTNNMEFVKIFSDRHYRVGNHVHKNPVMPAAGNQGNCDIINLLLHLGFDVNSKNSQNDTAVSLALQKNHLAAVKLLTDRGANFSVKDINLMLLYAIKNEDRGLAEYLLDEAKLHFNNSQIVTEAILVDNTNILMLLWSNGFQMSPKVYQRLYSWVQETRNDLLKSLKKQHEKSLTDENLYQALHLAVYLGDENFVKEVLEEGIDFDSVDIYNSIYPLHFATKNRRLDADLLIKETAWVNQMYIKCRFWKLDDMRNYILQRYPLGEEDVRRKHKYPYLTKKYEIHPSER